MQTKICSKCKEEKEVCLFTRDKRTNDGVGSYCKSCNNLRSTIWRKNQPNYLKEYYQNNTTKNREKENIRGKLWREHNREKSREYEKNKRETNLLYKVSKNITSDLSKFVKLSNVTKNNKTMKYLGCDPHQLRKHLESQFTEGMTWENYGVNGWHIDHKLPKTLVMYENDLYLIYNYKNLQPLWFIDNIRKSNKILY